VAALLAFDSQLSIVLRRILDQLNKSAALLGS